MKKLEKFIYSVKYLPQLLYFGTVAWLIYTSYYGDYLENKIQIFGYMWDGSLLEDIFFFWFLYITYLAAKNLKKKRKQPSIVYEKTTYNYFSCFCTINCLAI